MGSRDEAAEGWRAALALAIKVFILNPHDPIAASLVLHLIYEARERDMRRALGAIDRLPDVAAPTTMIRVEGGPT